MTWTVLKTWAGAQQSRRTYQRAETKNGYAMVTSLDPRVSAIEKELADRGISFYMPSEFKAVRRRDKTNSWVIRRGPLLPRYLFVESFHGDPRDIPGAAGRLTYGERPLEVSVIDILTLRTVEANSELAAERFIDLQRNQARAEAKRSGKEAYKAAKRRFNPGNKVKVMWGAETGREATVLAWSDQEKVRLIVERLEGAEEVDVPFEFIRLQEAAE
jgi:transcription antitermination factor NusG